MENGWKFKKGVIDMMSYEEYLQERKQKDTRQAWKWWKMEVFGMSEKEAIKASYKLYKPLRKE